MPKKNYKSIKIKQNILDTNIQKNEKIQRKLRNSKKTTPQINRENKKQSARCCPWGCIEVQQCSTIFNNIHCGLYIFLLVFLYKFVEVC